MTEIEDSKVSEVSTTEEKCELGMSSYQDPTKPDCNGIGHHNQPNDHKNSYVDVAEADSVNDDIVFNKNVDAGTGSLNVFPESNTMVDDQVPQTENLDVVNREVREPLNREDNENVAWLDEFPPLVSRRTVKCESSLEDGSRLQVSKCWVDVLKNPRNCDVKVKPRFPSYSATSRGGITGDVSVMSRKEVSYSFDVKNDDAPKVVLGAKDVEMRDPLDAVTGCCKELFQTENEATGNCESKDISVASSEGCSQTENEETGNCESKDISIASSEVCSQTETEDTGNCESNDISIASSEGYSQIENEETGNCESKDISIASSEGCSETENEETRDCESKDTSIASSQVCSIDVLDGENASIKAVKKPFNFLIKVPRSDNEILREQIRLAKLHLDEKTKLRDAIQVQIQEKRSNSQIHGIDYEYAKGETRNARKLVRSKRMEIDSLLSVIKKAKNALSVEDMNSQIRYNEYRMQHDTITLKEEKQLISEIKQLKQRREQVSTNLGSQDEIKQALAQREEVEEHLKILRKELDIFKDGVLKAETAFAEAEKKFHDAKEKVKELQAQFRAADDVRHAAYAQWQRLRTELSKKNKQFFKYKDDATIARDYAYGKDTEALYSLCRRQVEDFMELWNTNVDFRREYVRSNTRNTVRRFGTLDGRSLGPDEEPPVLLLHSNADERVDRMVSTPVKVDLASQIPSPEVKRETSNENVNSDGKLMKKKVTEPPKNQQVSKGPAVNLQANNGGFDTVSGRDLIDDVYEEPIRSRDEVESKRKEEEMRREEEAEAKLKEQRRLEALAKANEARERKKRQAEKLRLRAELKIQKEAENREKEREKKLRKKERKKGAVTDANNDSNNNCETAENSKDVEVKDMPNSVAPKKPKKSNKNKAKSIPPALCNRNKTRLQQWMWVAVTSFIILVLFCSGWEI